MERYKYIFVILISLGMILTTVFVLLDAPVETSIPLGQVEDGMNMLGLLE